MQIDNYQEAQALSDRLEATLPFQVRAGKELLKNMRDRGEFVSVDDLFTVDFVKYSGDIGGINCGLKPLVGKTKQQYVVSITHLEIDSQHPLASEVQAYQRRRIQRLKLQEQGGFAAELLAKRNSTAKRKGTKGFKK